MAMGNYCLACHGMVDNNEFNFGKGICYECEIDKEREEKRNLEATGLMNAEAKQLRMEGIFE